MNLTFRAECLNAVLPTITAALPNAEWVVVSKKPLLAVDTGKIDDNGRPVFATIEVIVKDNDGTKTHDGFDIEAARAAYAEKMANAAEKASKPKATKATPSNAEAAAKREARMAKLREWWLNEAEENKGYTSTIIQKECAIYADLDVMRVGIDMKLLSEQLPTQCEMRVENGKRHYYKS